MPTELSTLLATVGTSVALVKDALPLIETIRSGWRAQNDAVKQQLTAKVEQLGRAIHDTGALAHVIENYLQNLENIKELLFLCKRMEHLMDENIKALRNRMDPHYQSTWRTLDLLMENLDRERSTSRKAFLDRIPWYDDQDRHQMDLLLGQFSQAFERASAHRETRAVDNLLHRIRALTSTLLDAEALLKHTIYEKGLKTLQSLQT